MTDAEWMHFVGLAARKSLCLKSKCGALIVAGDEVIGRGYNAPPLDDLTHRKCHLVAPSRLKPKSDRTCCVHAECRAITAALKTSSRRLEGATMYFTRINESGNVVASGLPYCTLCSRFALDVGITSWVLWHGPDGGGFRHYEAGEYNRLSHLYDEAVSPNL